MTSALREVDEANVKAAKEPDPVSVENTALHLPVLNLMLKANLVALEEGRELPFPQIFE